MKTTLAKAGLIILCSSALIGSAVYAGCFETMSMGVHECNTLYPRYVPNANDDARYECLLRVSNEYYDCIGS
jgi:hypothetical protein